MAYSVRLWLETRAGSDVCHRVCAYTVLQGVYIPGVCTAGDGPMHFKEPLKSFDKRPSGFRLPSVVFFLMNLNTYVYDDYKCFNSFSAGTVCIARNLTSKDVKF